MTISEILKIAAEAVQKDLRGSGGTLLKEQKGGLYAGKVELPLSMTSGKSVLQKTMKGLT